MSDLFTPYAAEYLAKGWRPFPVKQDGSKTGIPAGVTGRSGVITPETVAQWLADAAEGKLVFTDQNIGLRMEGVLGVDIDQYDHKHGYMDYLRIESHLEGVGLPPTYMLTARDEGQRRNGTGTRFFRVPVGMEFQDVAGKGMDIEILQYHHRYALAYPSIHPSGRQYQWYGPDGQPSGIPAVADLPELPQEYIDLWLKRRTAMHYTTTGEIDISDVDLTAWTAGLSDGEVTDELRARLGEAAEGWEEGHYDESTKAIWGIAKLSILAPELEGLKGLWDEIFEARMYSTAATTPQEQRVSDIKRSLRGAIAKWQAYAKEHPLPSTEAMAWAKNHTIANATTPASSNSSIESTPVSTETPTAPAIDASGDVSLLDEPLGDYLAERLRDLVSWTGGHGWLLFRDGMWNTVTEATITNIVMEELKLLRAEQSRKTMDAQRHSALANLAKLAKIETIRKVLMVKVERSALDFDTQWNLINTPKGVLDLRTLEVYPHHPKYLFTKMTKGSYIPGYTHPDFEQAKKSLPEESINWLQWKFGQALTGYPASDDKVVFLKGDGENGKSVLVTPLMYCMGSFASMVPDGVLLSNKNGNHETDVVTLLGVRMAVLEELPETRHLDAKRLKAIAGTEMMTGRFLYQKHITWAPTHSLVVTTNYQPQINDNDWGTWRRMVMVNFPYRFRKPGQPLETPDDVYGDPNLRDRMKYGKDGQWDAMFTWLAVGAYSWYKNGKVIPEPGGRIAMDTENWRRESDSVMSYVDDFMEFDKDGMVLANDVVKHYNHYLKSLGYSTASSKTIIGRFVTHRVLKASAIKFGLRARVPESDVSRPGDTFYSGVDLGPMPERPTIWKGLKYKNSKPANPFPGM